MTLRSVQAQSASTLTTLANIAARCKVLVKYMLQAEPSDITIQNITRDRVSHPSCTLHNYYCGNMDHDPQVSQMSHMI